MILFKFRAFLKDMNTENYMQQSEYILWSFF